jgi:two-component system chemotaxis sensor kinase CheA
VEQSDGDWLNARKEMQTSLESWTDDLDALSRTENELGVALDRFQEVALALRARPAAEILDPLQRLVQDVAQHLGKVVELNVIGADVGLDHSALDVLADPVHRLVWFAVAHGIEKPIERREVGKPATGHISVTVTKTADHVQVTIEDDGNGLDPAATLQRARELGWTKDAQVPAGKPAEWVLKDGFGMVGNSYDVEGLDLAAVSAELQAHRGRLDVSSEPRQGTRFVLDVPLDMVVIDGMVMCVGDIRYVVPIEAVRRIVKPEPTQIVHSSADGDRNMLRLEEELIPIQALRQGSSGLASVWNEENLLLVVEQNEQSLALIVDELIGQQQVLIQPLQGYLADVQSLSGCALLGEGDVGMVLDLYQMRSQVSS